MVGLGLLVAGYIIWFFRDIVTWIIISWVLSLIGRPLMNLFLRIKIGRFQVNNTIAAGLTITTFLLGIGILLALFIPLIIRQAQNLASVDYYAIALTLEEPLTMLNEWMEQAGIKIRDKSLVEQVEDALRTYFNPNDFDPKTISNWLTNAIGVAGNLVITFFSIVFITFFFLQESKLFTRTLQSLTPNKYNEKIFHIVQDSTRMLSRYFSGVLLQMTIMTIGIYIGLTIFGVPNALLIAFFAALVNVIPYAGPIIGSAFAILLTISSNIGVDFYDVLFPLLIRVAAVFAIMQMIDNFILQPFIFSNRVNAHPLEIFVVVLAAAKIGGIVGMVIAIPSYTVIRIIARNFLSEFDIVRNITKGLDREKAPPGQT